MGSVRGMTDLIKRLRDRHEVFDLKSDLGWQPSSITNEAADCIEELIGEQILNLAAIAIQKRKRDAAEAKLAKAVEALRFYSPQTVGGITFVGGDDAGKRAAAALAELEGK